MKRLYATTMVIYVCSVLTGCLSTTKDSTSTSTPTVTTSNKNWCATAEGVTQTKDGSECAHKGGMILETEESAERFHKSLKSASSKLWCVTEQSYEFVTMPACKNRAGKGYISMQSARAEHHRLKQASTPRESSSETGLVWCVTADGFSRKTKTICDFMGGESHSSRYQAYEAYFGGFEQRETGQPASADREVVTVNYMGGTFTGALLGGKPHGQGTWTHPNAEYVGEWKNGIIHGQGTFTSYGGKKYVGEWKDDKPWQGSEYDQDGNVTATYLDGVRTEK